MWSQVEFAGVEPEFVGFQPILSDSAKAFRATADIDDAVVNRERRYELDDRRNRAVCSYQSGIEEILPTLLLSAEVSQSMAAIRDRSINIDNNATFHKSEIIQKM